MFAYMDHDGDQAITFADFTKTLGAELHPGEAQYFRMDVPNVYIEATCAEAHCFAAP